MKKKLYDRLYVIQSYPNALSLANLIQSQSGKIAIIVSLDYALYKFLRKTAPENCTVYYFGVAAIFRKRIFAFLRLPVVNYIEKKIKKFETRKLVVNYLHWCDVGSLYISQIKHSKLEIWVPYEERRYVFKKKEMDEKINFLKNILKKTENLLAKFNVYDQNNQFVTETIGLDPGHELLKGAPLVALDQPCEVHDAIQNKISSPVEPYILFVERDVLKTRHASLKDYFKLLRTVKNLADSCDLAIYVKFKPRQHTFAKELMHKAAGLKILPTETPAPVFGFDSHCKIIIGITSSALAVDYQKPFVCLAAIKEVFDDRFHKNIQSLNERSPDSAKIKYPINLEELNVIMGKLRANLYKDF